MTFWLAVLGMLVFPVVSTTLFWRLRRPVLGFAVGTLPIFLAWLTLILQTERSLAECARNVEAFCEWTGIGQLIVTLLAVVLLALAAVFASGAEVIAAALEEANAPAAQGRRKATPLYAGSLLIILAAAPLGLALGIVFSSLTRWYSAFWFSPMLGLAAAITWMVYQEYRFLRG
jgi:hypothetical protein